MDFLAQVIVWLNALANAVGRVLLAPIGVLPGWLSWSRPKVRPMPKPGYEPGGVTWKKSVIFPPQHGQL